MKAIPLIIVSEDTAAACGWFNANAFPRELRDLVDACRERSALVRFFVRNVRREVCLDLVRFEEEYKERGVGSAAPPANGSAVAFYDGTAYLACLHGVFYTLKSFLDVYAHLIQRLLGDKAGITKFSKKEVGSTKLSGGTLIHWLRCSAPKASAAPRLADVVESHSRGWIHDAVGYRDTLTHHGSIKGLLHMRMEIHAPDSSFRPEEVKRPLMPDGTDVVHYAQHLLQNLDCLIEETLKLIPAVDGSKLSQKGRPLSGQG